MTDVRFAIIVTGKKAGTLGRNGARYWVCEGEWGPVGTDFVEGGPAPKDLITFSNRIVAEMFAKTWKGHPWWVRPKSWEIIEVLPVYKQVLAGYERRDAA